MLVTQGASVMSHPFFDAPAYPWARPEAVPAHKALYQGIPQPNRISALYKQCDDGSFSLAPLTLTQVAANDIWQEALELLTVARRLKRLCEIILGNTAY